MMQTINFSKLKREYVKEIAEWMRAAYGPEPSFWRFLEQQRQYSKR